MHRLLLPFLAICLSLSPFLGCESDEARLASHLERGDAYAEEEAYEEAVIEFRNALQLAPNDGEIHFKLSQSFLKLGAVKEGFWELRETVRLDPSNHEAMIQFASLSILAGELEEALQRADEVIAQDDTNMQAYVVKAQAHEGLEDLDAARAAFARASEIDPENVEPLLIFADFVQRQGDREAAELLFRRATEIAENFPSLASLATFLLVDDANRDEARELLIRASQVAGPNEVVRAYSMLANLHYQDEAYDLSFAVLEEGIERAENPLDLIYLLSRVHRVQGNDEAADELIERATVARPDDVGPFLVLSALRGERGDYEGALVAADRATEIDPENTTARMRRAEALLEIAVRGDQPERMDEAREIVEATVAAEPSNAEAHFVHGKIRMQDGDTEAATQSLRAAIDTRPDWPEAHYLLGSVLMMSGERTAARTEFARTLELDANRLEARAALARVHAALGEHEYAVEEGRRYLASRPDGVETRIVVAQSLLSMNQTQAALEIISNVAEEDRDGRVHFALGRIKLGQGDRESARSHLEAAAETLPHQPDILVALLELDGAEDRLGDSIERIGSAVAAKPDDAKLQMVSGLMAVMTGKLAEAEAAYKQAIEVDDRTSEAYTRLADLYARTGRTGETIETYEASLSVNPAQPRLHHTLGLLYERTGELARAVKHYEEAIRHQEDHAEAKNNLAYLYAESGKNLDRALDLAQDAKQLMPDDPNAADTLGWVLYRRGVPSAAIAFLREAEAGLLVRVNQGGVGDQANLGLIRHHLAVAYEASGDAESARDVLASAFESHGAWVDHERSQGRTVADEAPWYGEARALEGKF